MRKEGRERVEKAWKCRNLPVESSGDNEWHLEKMRQGPVLSWLTGMEQKGLGRC